MVSRRVVIGCISAMAVLRPLDTWPDGIKIYLLVPYTDKLFYNHILMQMKDEALQCRIEVVQGSTSEQAGNIEDAINSGADGIIIYPTDDKSIAPVIGKAIDKRVSVVTIGRQITDVQGILAHVEADDFTGSRQIAEWVRENFSSGADIVLIQGGLGSRANDERISAVRSGLADGSGRYKVVAEPTANWQRAEARTVTEKVLQSGRLDSNRPNVIIAANDDMALGVIEAIHSAGSDYKNIKVFGFEATPDALAAVASGQLAGTVEQFFGEQGRKAVDILVDFLRNGNRPQQKLSAMQSRLIKINNIGDAEHNPDQDQSACCNDTVKTCCPKSTGVCRL
jgi:inositol transport system substrate-binding protein